jgi:hypothetical protein
MLRSKQIPGISPAFLDILNIKFVAFVITAAIGRKEDGRQAASPHKFEIL